MQDKKIIDTFFGKVMARLDLSELQPPMMPSMPGMQQPMMLGMPTAPGMPGMPTNVGGNTNIENGYKPFVTISELGQIKIIIKNLTVSKNHIECDRKLETFLHFTNRPSCISDICHSIINSDTECIKDNLTLLRSFFNSLPVAKRAEVKELFYTLSTDVKEQNSIYSDIWNRFVKKIEPIVHFNNGTSADKMVLQHIQDTIYSLIGKNIFYN